jgi:hypothetical protein
MNMIWIVSNSGVSASKGSDQSETSKRATTEIKEKEQVPDQEQQKGYTRGGRGFIR